MSEERRDPYNPLEKLNLARSIQQELLNGPVVPLGEFKKTGRRKKVGRATTPGAGVYAIYYTGSFPAYSRIAEKNAGDAFDLPIYIGKAIPQGGRKGGLDADAAGGTKLAERLGDHAKSISEVSNLDLADFYVRFLVVDDIWIPLGENMLIHSFKPIWNRAVDGFGNKVPGARRTTQFKSPWDVLHPIRKGFERLAESGLTPEDVAQRVDNYLSGQPLKPLPKKLADQIEGEDEEVVSALEASDELPLGSVD